MSTDPDRLFDAKVCQYVADPGFDGTVRQYLATMVAEYEQQARTFTDAELVRTAAAKRDAYIDALRVLDDAIDAAARYTVPEHWHRYGTGGTVCLDCHEQYVPTCDCDEDRPGWTCPIHEPHNGNSYAIELVAIVEANTPDEAQHVAGALFAGLPALGHAPAPMNGPGSWAPNHKSITLIEPSDPYDGWDEFTRYE
jgi:hypothetical protein